MFMARPINLKTEVWDRIDEYLNKKAEEDRNFKPNRSLFLEEAAIAFLDAQDKPAEEESSDDSFDFGSSDDDSSEDSSDDSSEDSSEDDSSEDNSSDDDSSAESDDDSSSEESSDTELSFDTDTESTEEASAEPASMEVAEEPVEAVEEEAPKPKKRGKRKG